MEDSTRRVTPQFGALLEAAAANPTTVHSRHFDELGISGWECLGVADVPKLWQQILAQAVAYLEAMRVPGIVAGVVVPLRICDAMPSPKDLQRGWEFLVPTLDEHQPPSVYAFPADALGQWELDIEDYRFPLLNMVGKCVDHAFVRYWRDADEIAAGEEYTAAVYLLRAVGNDL